MPNTIAYIVLLSWPLVSLLMFRRMPPLRALIWTILGGYLFLPSRTGFDFPMLPTIDKALVPSLTAAVLLMQTEKREKRMARNAARRARQVAVLAGQAPSQVDEGSEDATGNAPRRKSRMTRMKSRLGPLTTTILIILLALPVGVFLTNQEALSFTRTFIPGVGLYDVFSMSMKYGVLILPFLIGRKYLTSPDAGRELLRAFVWGGLLYFPLILIELKMSPQLNTWIYGFFPHNFLQHTRGDGYRPIVFLDHGLRVAIFMCMSCLAAATLCRLQPSRKLKLATLVLILGVICTKSATAMLILIVLLPMVMLASRASQAIFAGMIATTVLVYPLLRGADLIPTEAILERAQAINPERAHSLSIRFLNEDRLLRRANEKPYFGWGPWGRSRLYNEKGEDYAKTDGIWVILMGVGGWFGYLAQFGLLCLPLVAGIARRNIDPVIPALSLVMAANLIDMIPNSSLSPLSWLIAGALTGLMINAVDIRSVVSSRRRRPGWSSRQTTA